MITVEDYLNHWKLHYGSAVVPDDELTYAMRDDAEVMVNSGNALLQAFGQDRDIASGWRPTEVNKLVPGAALHSKHTLCLAIDIEDPDGDLDHWCFANPQVLESIGLWQEHPASTKGWCHVQQVPYGSWTPTKPRWFYP